MGIVTGYVCLIMLLLLMAKFVTNRIKAVKINRILHKIHLAVSIIFVIMIAVHLVLVIPVLKTRSFIVTGTGIFLMILAVILTVVSLFMKKNGIVSMKFHHIIIIFLLVGLIGHLVFYYVDFAGYKSAIADINVNDVDITEIKDGSYVGEYDAGYIYAKVQVIICKGRISDVKIIEHRNERGSKAEAITDEMVNQQKINVDAISSATNSSKVIKKAVENALNQN